MPPSDAALVFIVVPVTDVMTTVFNGPMAPIVLQHVLSRRQGRRFAGDAIGNIRSVLATLFVYREPFHHTGLPDMREVQVGVELGGDPDLADFEPAMVAIGGGEIRRVLTVGKIAGRLFQQRCLIAREGEVVMSAALFHEITGELTLGEQGIGTDCFASNLDGLQQRDGRFDFMGLLLLVAPRDGQGSYFFGV